MKDYLSFEGLTHFFNKLLNKFAAAQHTHTKDEITDLTDQQSMVIAATDDGNGNVTLVTSYDVAADDSNT